MEFFKGKTKIDFMAQRQLAALFSAFVFVGSLCVLILNGLNLGLDFTGGTQVVGRFAPLQVSEVRDQMRQAGFREAIVQPYGGQKAVMIRIANQQQNSQHLADRLKKIFPRARIDSVDFIGPQVGKTLMTNGLLAIVVSLLATMLYITLRFDYRFSISAAVALIHDPILILGIFSLFHIQFDLITLAAVLTIIGYSLNDTVVVYDRVRENFGRIKHLNTQEVMNLSINDTLSRTIMTSGLTLLVVIALLVFGGESLFGFSLALTIGIVIGTYSSIYVAGALAVLMGLSRDHLLVKSKPKQLDVV